MNKNDATTTDQMIEALDNADSFADFNKKFQDEFVAVSLHDSIQKIIEKKGFSKSGVIRDADLDRTYGYQIINGTRKPTRDKLIQLAFGLKLDADEADRLLRIAGFSPLYPRVQCEAAAIFCMNKGYSYIDYTIFIDNLD